MPFSPESVPIVAAPAPGAARPDPARRQRLVDAARDLADEMESAGFTVAQVAQRASSSLKGFYATFAGKDDLLLALLAEESRAGATVLREIVDTESESAARVRAYVRGVFGLATLPDAQGYARVLVHEHRRLADTRGAELDAALAPLVDLLAAELEAASPTAEPGRDASTLFALVLTRLHAVVTGRAEPEATADDLFRFCWHGLAPRPTTAPSRRPA